MAEAVGLLGLVIGVPGLLQSCVHGYRTLIDSKHIAKDSAKLHTQLRIQEARLVDIGRSWGLLVSEGTGDVSSAPPALARSLIDQMRLQSAESISPLVVETMSEICGILSDTKKLSSRYGLVSTMVDSTPGNSGPSQVPVNPKNISPLKRLRWSVTDKKDFAQLVNDLTIFNNTLEKFVPAQQRAGLELALPLHFSSVEAIEDLEMLRQASEQYQSLQQLLDLRTFRINTENKRPSETMQRSFSTLQFGDLTEDKLKEPRILAKFASPSGSSQMDTDVIVEWKGYDEAWVEEKRVIIRDRIESLARLLQRAGHVKNLQVLRCLGYVDDVPSSRFGFILALPSRPKAVGWSHIDEKSETVDDSTANNQQSSAPPQHITLYSILGSEMQSVPELGVRFSMATALCRTLLQLHAAGWLHKGIRSENVLLLDTDVSTLSEPATAEKDLIRPWLVGFDYSRPDTDAAMSETLSTYSKLQDIYRHPDSIKNVGAANPVTTRYRRAFDVYSLGCVLLEIGLWIRLEEAWKEKYSNNPSVFKERLVEIWSKDLSRKCGKTYESVVRTCLQGLRHDQQSDAASVKNDLDVFYRDVICPLQGCVV